MKYDWSEYYRKAYEEERKKNIVLAGKVADAEAKRTELQEKYAALCANPLYKASRIPSLVKRGYGKVKREVFSRGDSGKADEAAAGELATDYRERVKAQRDRYAQWIKEKEPVLWKRCQDALLSGENIRQYKCQVIPYRSLSGITSLTEIAGNADILLLTERPEELDGQAADYTEKWFAVYPKTKVLYGAEDHISDGKRCYPWFKPCWSPDTLLGFFYFGSYVALNAEWAKQVPLSGNEDARYNLYDFMLRLLRVYFDKPKEAECHKEAVLQTAVYGKESGEITSKEDRFPEIICLELILYHRYVSPESGLLAKSGHDRHAEGMEENADSEFWGYEKKYLKLKQDFINKINYRCYSYRTCHPNVWSMVPECEAGGKETDFSVSVVILSKDHPELLKNCIGSFLERTFMPGLRERVEFIVVDNGSSEENCRSIQKFLAALNAETSYMYHPMEFNFSAMCNIGAREAGGEYILLLNDDVEIIEENWLRIMIGQAMMPGTGAVGAKLWYPEEEKIQHAGITNMDVGPSHKLTTFPDDRTYYYGHNTITYDMIAVTAACMLVKKTLYEEMGGFDEEMAVAYNDVDFCFKLVRAGYRNVLRNDAVLLHHESASRGSDELSEEKMCRLIRERAMLYKKHPLFYKFDPYYSEQLAGDALNYQINYQYPYENVLLTAVPEKKEGKGKLRKVRSGAVMLTLERIRKQRNIYLEKPDILEAEGWCYMLGQDNCLFERWLVLEAEEGDFYYQIPVEERLRPDVEAILPQQKNIALSGFTCRILWEDIAPGNYAVGMLYRNLCNGKLFYGRSDKSVSVAGRKMTELS